MDLLMKNLYWGTTVPGNIGIGEHRTDPDLTNVYPRFLGKILAVE